MFRKIHCKYFAFCGFLLFPFSQNMPLHLKGSGDFIFYPVVSPSVRRRPSPTFTVLNKKEEPNWPRPHKEVLVLNGFFPLVMHKKRKISQFKTVCTPKGLILANFFAKRMFFGAKLPYVAVAFASAFSFSVFTSFRRCGRRHRRDRERCMRPR